MSRFSAELFVANNLGFASETTAMTKHTTRCLAASYIIRVRVCKCQLQHFERTLLYACFMSIAMFSSILFVSRLTKYHRFADHCFKRSSSACLQISSPLNSKIFRRFPWTLKASFFKRLNPLELSEACPVYKFPPVKQQCHDSYAVHMHADRGQAWSI